MDKIKVKLNNLKKKFCLKIDKYSCLYYTQIGIPLNTIIGNKGKWLLYKASCRHVPPRH